METNKELIAQLREYASNSGYSHTDYADTMRDAAAVLAKQADVALVGPTETEYAAVFANDVLDEVMKERDHYHDIADGLAESIAEYFGADIGEHSSANCPWAEALRVIEEAPAIAQRVVSSSPSAPCEAVPVTLKDTVKNQAMTSFALAGQVNDLSVLCRRLLHALNNEKPNHPIAIKAADYLKRNSLQGNPVRAEDVLRDTTPPAAPVALSDEQIRADLKKGLFVGYGETHRAVVEETVQVLESAASYNLSMFRTILAHDQQERANRLRSILNQTTKEPK